LFYEKTIDSKIKPLWPLCSQSIDLKTPPKVKGNLKTKHSVCYDYLSIDNTANKCICIQTES